MNLEHIAVLNLLRRKGKAAFVLIGLMVGVATTVALISLVEALEHNIQSKLEKYGANILVLPKSQNLSLSYGGLSLGGVQFDSAELMEADLNQIKTIKYARNVAAVGPLVLGAVEVKGQPVLLAGVDFDQGKILKPWWKVKGAWPGPDEVVVGSEAARQLALEPGRTLELGGRSVTITGILEPTGSQDDSLILTPHPTAQAILNKPGRISMAEVAALCTACPIEEMVAQISEVLPGAKVMAIQSVVKGRMETISHFRRIFYGVSALVVGIGGLVVMVTMMGSVRERRRDIGIFRAVGFRRRQVMRVILLEAGLVSGLAGVLGGLMGFGGARAVLPFITEAHGEVSVFDPALAGISLGVAVLVGLSASLYPALMAARMDPNEALRSL